MMTELLKQKLKQLPEKPGVYIMKDASDKIIYVGKARILKNRVRQYFQSNRNHPAKVVAMVKRIDNFEIIITNSELEALILECNLIKKHHPRYNISLKDDKSYPYLKLTVQEMYPRLFLTHHLEKDGAKYFGPYTNIKAVRETLGVLRKIFPLRTCKQMQVRRPCLEYYIGRCLAPCQEKISPEVYGEMVQAILLFLSGKSDSLAEKLHAEMQKAAKEMDFEKAARLRDQWQAVQIIVEKQKIALQDEGNRDIVGLARSEENTCIQIFYVRHGKMTGRSHFFLQNTEGETDVAVLQSFLGQYYNTALSYPAEILLPVILPDKVLLEAWLRHQSGKKVELFYPQKGMKRELVAMAEMNAKRYLIDIEERSMAKEQAGRMAVLELQKYLQLPNPPKRIECFDISHIQGSETVASMVVFVEGRPLKRAYRHFKIQSTEGKPDDFLSMREVVYRRYVKHALTDCPDLIVIDGGKGQLGSALEIIRGAGLDSLPVVGLAKQFEYIFVEGKSDPVILPRDSKALFLVQQVRDEAHRFAITYHRKLRGKRNLTSILDHIEGIGPKRRQALWQYFGNLEKIKAANIEELAAAPRMNIKVATAVYNFFAAHRK